MAALRLRVTRAARRDIEAIRRRTIERWGRGQWLVYFGGMGVVMERVRAEPMAGPSRDILAPGLRSMLYRSHVIFYVETTRGEQVILRVLDQKQNAEALAWTDMMHGEG